MTGLDPRVFGRYQIRRKLAGGGMGRVFLAYDPGLNREVGLKLIDLGTDQESLDIIAAEHRGAQLQDQLAQRESGGRVAQIFEVGELDGYFFIAMEYIEGEDLSELVGRGPMEPGRAASIALDILEVLTRAHTFSAVIDDRQHRGIIHGDIKPRNIRITPQGHVKVLDFGIAKAVSMTRSVTFNQFGSVPYSSPERLQTGDMDVRSDVWSVGVVLFEMLAGKAYFQAESAQKLEWFIRNYSAVQPAIWGMPAGLREVLMRAHLEATRRTSRVEDAGTRRTTAVPVDDATRRTSPAPPSPAAPPRPAAPAGPVKAPASGGGFRPSGLVGVGVVFVLAAMFTVAEIRQWSKAGDLRRRLESGQLSADAGAAEYKELARGAWLAWPLYPARVGLREKYAAEADRVITDYREASESTPVYVKDWKRAQSAISAAVTLAPEDTAIRGRASLIDGHLKYRAGDIKGARSSFEAARERMSKSPDPHLGLAMIHLQDSDLDKAEAELNEAQRNGFRPGRREQKALADAYRRRGQKWIAVAKKAHDIVRMETALKKADVDLEHAQNLYNSVAPFFDGIEMSERVAAEREQAQRTLGAAQLAQRPAGNP
ncbi:MAG: serine/threonine protein kinase [Acidobacteriia bacterium]|nr:serine/threonine protein kinase [Terriglobia bacterium]